MRRKHSPSVADLEAALLVAIIGGACVWTALVLMGP